MSAETSRTLEAWGLLRKMLDDMTVVVETDAESAIEKLDGLRALGRVAALCLELNLDIEADAPRFYAMETPTRFVGGPNPDGHYLLSMIDGDHAYRIRGQRGSSDYLGFQVLAGVGLKPRRMAAYVSDTDLSIDAEGRFSFVFAAHAPSKAELAQDAWVEIPEDASAIVVREYSSNLAAQTPAALSIETLEPVGAPLPPSDEAIAERISSAAWTIMKLMTLHRTVKPELLEQPNRFVTAEAAELGSENTTPDNLYMLGSFRISEDEAVVIDFTPPETRYWSVTLENVWHECIEPRRRASSITNARAVPHPDGRVRLVIAQRDPGVANWLDTGGRARGFMLFRWLDNPSAPEVETRVLTLADLAP